MDKRKITTEMFILNMMMVVIVQVVGGGLCLFRDHKITSMVMVLTALIILIFLIAAGITITRVAKKFKEVDKQWVALKIFIFVALLFYIIAFVLFVTVYKTKVVPKISISFGNTFLWISGTSAIMKYLGEIQKKEKK